MAAMDVLTVARRFEDRAVWLRAEATGIPKPLATAMRRRAAELELEAHVLTEVLGAPASGGAQVAA